MEYERANWLVRSGGLHVQHTQHHLEKYLTDSRLAAMSAAQRAPDADTFPEPLLLVAQGRKRERR